MKNQAPQTLHVFTVHIYKHISANTIHTIENFDIYGYSAAVQNHICNINHQNTYFYLKNTGEAMAANSRMVMKQIHLPNPSQYTELTSDRVQLSLPLDLD